ncbi:F-box/kelch-repeat protein At3g23880 [Cajanus cajan]|uniref:F-box/kelch-repeat protein At3g23880 family n=1 Tax=Cajanus cajan TaxID=3821 RepID=A0A151S8F0_CAJCA|nr:F-box/kelch-repeat protein At3g23880 [Cajanus cajan]KYP51072.1 F-box/kelch-repeat protein At3g23880 family [Cajanus cajan]
MDESPSLPDELILEILHRVPVRSLLQFRCVCKSWRTLISNPQFANDHLSTSIADPNMTHHRLVSSTFGDPRKIVSFSLQSLFQNPSSRAKPLTLRMSHKYHIVGSYNGLLCLFDVYQGYFRLWNPSTRLKSKRLSIGVYPDVIITYHGFGYDHVNHKYKLLAVVEDVHETLTKLYSFGSNSCTVLQNFPCEPTRMQGKFVSGTLNWIAKGGVSDDQWVILSLDLATETYSKMLLLDGDAEKILSPGLQVLRNCLCVCFFDSKSAHWIVWLMKEYGVHDSWIKLMMVPCIGRETSAMYPSSEPLCILEDGVVLMKNTYAKLVLYNLNDGRFDYLRIRGELGFNMHIYLESLVSPQC